MSDQNRDYATIRRNVEKGISRQRWTYRLIFFGTHLVFYLVSMLVIWGTVIADSQLRGDLLGSRAEVIILLPSILWSLIILSHVASLYTESSMGEKAIRERVLMREVGEEILRKGLVDDELLEKPKRRAGVSEGERKRLSDDGELVSIDEDEGRGYNARTNHASDS